MLHAALKKAYSVCFGDMQNAVQSGVESLDFYCEPALGLSLACIAADLGIPCEDGDLALTAALSKLSAVADKEVLQLMPSLAAALFVCDKWERAVYLPRLGAFENNEHCIQVALSKLLGCFFLLSQTSLGADQRDPLDAMDGAEASASQYPDAGDAGEQGKKVCKRLAVRDRYKAYVERYLRISAQTLLVQRETESKVVQKHAVVLPHRSMTLALEYFTSLSPTVDCAMLERFLPNYLVHSDVLDVSLGRHKTADHLRVFTHPVAAQADNHDQY